MPVSRLGNPHRIYNNALHGEGQHCTMDKNLIWKFLILLAITVTGTPAATVTITLNDDKTFSGTIALEDSLFYILSAEGSNVTIYKNLIKTIVTSGDPSVPAPTAPALISQTVADTAPCSSKTTPQPQPDTSLPPSEASAPEVVRLSVQADMILLPIESGSLDSKTLDSLATGLVSEVALLAPSLKLRIRERTPPFPSARTGIRISLIRAEQWFGTLSIFDFTTSAVIVSNSFTAPTSEAVISAVAPVIVSQFAAPAQVPLAAAVQSNQPTPSAPEHAPEMSNAAKTANISVLPAAGAEVAPDVADVLIAQLRQSLTETGAFSVMARDEMEEILKEQAFQLSGACDELTCAVQAGQVIGVSRIVATKLSRTSGNSFTATVSLIDVTTGTIILTASETRTGEMHATLKRILTNCATVIAGKPNADHTTYVALQERELQRKKIFEKRKAKRLLVSMSGGAEYPLFVFSPDPMVQSRTYYDKALPSLDTIKITNPSYSLPSPGIAPAFSLCFGLKVGGRLLLTTRADYRHKDWEYNSLDYNFTSDITDTAGGRVDHRFGPTEKHFDEYLSWSNVSGGIGMRIPLIESRLVNAGISLGGQYVYGISSRKMFEQRIDNWIWESGPPGSALVPNGMFRDNILVKYDSRLSGHGVGYRAGVFFEWNLCPSFGLMLEGEQLSNFVYGLKGKETVTSSILSANHVQAEKIETTTETYDVEMVEYVNSYGDRITGIYRTDEPRPSGAHRFFSEFSALSLNLAINLYF
jgi:hypothetical protein